MAFNFIQMASALPSKHIKLLALINYNYYNCLVIQIISAIYKKKKKER